MNTEKDSGRRSRIGSDNSGIARSSPTSSPLTTAAEQIAARIVQLVPIAKRDPNAGLRAEANAELIDCYAAMAHLQRNGIATPIIDMSPAMSVIRIALAIITSIRLVPFSLRRRITAGSTRASSCNWSARSG